MCMRSMHIYKYLVLQFCMLRIHKATCVHFSMSLQSLMVVQWINSSVNSYIVTILDSLFHNTTATPIRMERGG